MPYTTIEIKKYQYALFTPTDGISIQLYDTNNVEFAGIYFYPDSETPPAISQDPNGRYRLNYRRSSFERLPDVLRNEKPVSLKYWDGAGNNTHIGTGREPVGETEP